MKLLICASGSAHVGLLPAYVQLFRRQLGASIQIVLSRTAEQFMPRSILTAFTGGPVHSFRDEVRPTGQALHMELSEWADRILVLPATANTLYRLSHGAADDLLSTTVLASPRPVTIAPAMHLNMWRSAAVQRNVATLQQDGHHVLVGAKCAPTHREGDADSQGLCPTPRLVLTHLLHVTREQGDSPVGGRGEHLHVG